MGNQDATQPAELNKARDFCEKVRREAAERLRAMRQQSPGQMIDGTLEMVKKHPLPGVLVAGLLGFFLGRLFGGRR